MLEPSPSPDISSPSPAFPSREGVMTLTNQPRLVIEAEADGSGGTAPDVEAVSSGENHWERSGKAAAYAEQQSASGGEGNSTWRKARDALLLVLILTITIAITLKITIKKHSKTI
ncbi:MAG: hypothetical protein J5545_12005 [Bacteroidaceae bacterium]|nr:hypothetical protein [Bacteroidaceae bacterium]